jgi:hypothetical protein
MKDPPAPQIIGPEHAAAARTLMSPQFGTGAMR